jgi:drug/metabolite transporter (DMT)-like permease
MTMNNSSLTPSPRTGTYIWGVLLGAAAGLVAAVLYARATEEERRSGGEPQALQTGQIITLGLALLGIVRQVAEMGHPPAKKRR